MSKLPKKHTNDNHVRAVRMLGYCLTLSDSDTWLGAINVFRNRLAEDDLTALAYVSLKALSPENAALTAEAVLGRSGTPDVPFLSAIDQAAYWADWAAPIYINACVVAGINKMTQQDRSAFLDFVQGKVPE